MTIDLDKMAKDVVGAIFDDYEDERIMSRARWEEIVKKAVKPHVDKLAPGYGRYGLSPFASFVREFERSSAELRAICVDHPLLPDED